MPANLNRRALVAGAASAAVAIPAIAAAASQTSDPIFAIIEEHRRLEAAFLARAYFEDDLAEKDIKLEPAPGDYRTVEMVRVVNESIAARVAVAQTAPSTMAGLLAVLRYVREESNEHDFFFGDEEENVCFVATLERAVSGLLASAPLCLSSPAR